MKIKPIPATVYGVRWKVKGGRKWRMWDGMFWSDKEYAEERAEAWWGPKGHDCKYEVIRYTLDL